MLAAKIIEVGKDLEYQWPAGNKESYNFHVEYETKSEDGTHRTRLAFGERYAYGRERKRVVIWIDGHPYAQFAGADDFESSGELLSEIKIPGEKGERMCRYLKENIPERYSMFNIVGLSTRITGKGVHDSWAIVANIADHKKIARAIANKIIN